MLVGISLYFTTSPLFSQIKQMFDVRVPIRDGIALSSDIWLPEKDGKYPAIVIRTPYLKTEWQMKYPEYGKYFAEHGYAFIVQDVRGRGDSEGKFNFLFQEEKTDTTQSNGLHDRHGATGKWERWVFRIWEVCSG